MQSGVGGVANAVLSALARSELDHLSVYTEVMQDAVVELIDAGKVACASGTALTISPLPGSGSMPISTTTRARSSSGPRSSATPPR